MRWFTFLWASSSTNNAQVPLQATTEMLPVRNAKFSMIPPHVIDEGQSAYATLKARQDNPCWREAFGALDKSCDDLKLEDKQRLALSLTNCHLEDASRPCKGCNVKEDVHLCLARIREDTVFSTYTSFFITVDQICFFLQQATWQQTTETLVRDLDTMAKQSLNVQDQLFQKSNAIINQSLYSHSILEQSSRVATETSDSIHGLHRHIADMRKELQEHAEQSGEHHVAAKLKAEDLMEVIDSVHGLAFGFNKVWANVTAASYVLWTLNLFWVLTTLKTTRSARSRLFFLISTQTGVELALKYMKYQYSIRQFRTWGLLVASIVLASTIYLSVTDKGHNGDNITTVDQAVVMYNNQKPKHKANNWKQLTRREIVHLAKQNGVPGNLSSVKIIEKLQRM